MNISSLNPSQQAAVTCTDGPQLVIAGAGSGKTRVLTYKIAYLLERGVPAGHILALTFTNKAAREMKNRINQLVGETAARYLWMGTFHSICARLLRQEAEHIGYTRDYTIYDSSDSKSVLKHIVKDFHLDEKIYKPAVVHNRISMAKNLMQSPDQYAANRDYQLRDRFDKMFDMARIYAEYNRRLHAANAMDFDDILVLTNMLFQKFPDVLAKYQDLFHYILVDEYQDTNFAQYLIVKRLAEPQNNICVVGDDAQSIYSFRGADISNILNFQKNYPNAQLFKLERNYRSTQTIVNAANSLIRHNKGQIPKAVYSELSVGESISLSTHMTDRDEAKAVAQGIHLTKRLNTQYTYDDIAVMYRTNAQSRVIEDELRQLGIPYRIYGGTSFYQRKEIKDALAYMRLATNMADNEAFLRVVNFPARGIGDTTVSKLYEASRTAKTSLMQVAIAPDAAQLSAATSKKVMAFAQMIEQFAQQMIEQDAFTFAQNLLTTSGILREAKADTTQEGVARYENLQDYSY